MTSDKLVITLTSPINSADSLLWVIQSVLMKQHSRLSAVTTVPLTDYGRHPLAIGAPSLQEVYDMVQFGLWFQRHN